MADENKPDAPQDPLPSIKLDPVATLEELTRLNEIKARAAAGAARMVEDYLRERVLVLATGRAELMAANTQMAERFGALSTEIDGLRAEISGAAN